MRCIVPDWSQYSQSEIKEIVDALAAPILRALDSGNGKLHYSSLVSAWVRGRCYCVGVDAILEKIDGEIMEIVH